MYFPDAPAKRVEFRPPDPTANPYVAFSAMLIAGLDGIAKSIDPGDPVDYDLFEASEETLAALDQMPSSIEEALDALEADHDFLLEGGVFTPDLFEAYISFERETEVDQIRVRPHPWEFYLSFDA
jgi:glutamine synthetase